jgi:hypothetical protein
MPGYSCLLEQDLELLDPSRGFLREKCFRLLESTMNI